MTKRTPSVGEKFLPNVDSDPTRTRLRQAPFVDALANMVSALEGVAWADGVPEARRRHLDLVQAREYMDADPSHPVPRIVARAALAKLESTLEADNGSSERTFKELADRNNAFALKQAAGYVLPNRAVADLLADNAAVFSALAGVDLASDRNASALSRVDVIKSVPTAAGKGFRKGVGPADLPFVGLGTVQVTVLRQMQAHKIWKARPDGWMWKSLRETDRVLATLETRRLVKGCGEYGGFRVFQITDLGEAYP